MKIRICSTKHLFSLIHREEDTSHIVTVEDVFREQLQGADYDSGALEAAQKTADNTAEALGRIMKVLVDRGVLRLEDIKAILNLEDDVEIEEVPDDPTEGPKRVGRKAK